MRIALITETWLPSTDGVVTRRRHTVQHLATAGHDVLVLTPSPGPRSPGPGSSSCPPWPLPFIDRQRRIGLPLARSIRAPLGRFDPDVVHVVNPALMGWAALRANPDRYRTVVSFHTDLDAYLSRYRLQALRPVLTAMMRTTYRRADLALATSPTGQQRLAAVGVDSQLWPPAADNAVFGPRPDTSRPPVWLTDEPELPTVVCVGRLAPEKNLALLAAVLTTTARHHTPPWHLSFIGDGPDRRRLGRRFAGLPATFAGTRSAADLADAYATADALLMPSTTETVGLVLLEAAACGVPVVAADTPANRHTLQQHAFAVLVPPDAPPSRWVAAVTGVLSGQRPHPPPSRRGLRSPTTCSRRTGRWPAVVVGSSIHAVAPPTAHVPRWLVSNGPSRCLPCANLEAR